MVFPAPFSPTMATTVPAGRSRVTSSSTSAVGPGIRERDVVEADAVGRARAGTGRSADADERRRIVLEPRETPGAVHPDAAQETDLADRGADVSRQPRSGSEHQQHVARRRGRDPTRRTRRRRRRRRRRSPMPACATAAEPHRAAETGPYQRSHAFAPLDDQALADAGHAHLLAGRRRGRRREQMPGEAVRRRAALLRRALDGGPPRGRETPSAPRTPRAATSAG